MSASQAVSKDAKVVVVGAGFAGLSAVSTLVQAGFQQVKILEANGQVGGRVCTTKPFTKNSIELGANWIHGQKGNPLYQLAKKNNLLSEEADNSDDFDDYFFMESGKRISENFAEKVTDLFEKLVSKASDSKIDRKYRSLSLGDYLDAAFAESSLASKGDGPRVFEWCKRNECTQEAASSLFEVSAYQLSEYIDLDGEFYNSLGPGGYQALLDVLMKGLPSGTILNNKAVKSIQWDLKAQGGSNHPVKLICENDEVFEADHVIVTVSLGVLKQKAATMFEPSLPKSKLTAIEQLGFGTVDKIFLCFNEKFWPEDCDGIQLLWNEGPEDKSVYTSQSEGEAWKETWYKKICGFDAVARHPTVLCGWIAGREALHMETLQDSEVKEICLRLLRSFTGWSIPDVSKVLISRWGHNNRVLGSYSSVPKGVNGVEKQKDLGEPLPLQRKASDSKPLQVLFAGEATHENFYATTHGAYLSGIREAQRLINHYTIKTVTP